MYLLGIDCGNTVTKAVLVTTGGEEVASASRRADTLRAAPGVAERDMTALWRSVTDAIREALDTASVDGREVAAVGCTGHGNGLYALDRDCQPLGNAIQSLDTRAADLLAEWGERGITAAAQPTIRASHYAGQTAVLLGWLKRHQPHVYTQIGTVLMAKDFVIFCLTGTRSSDYTDMSTTALLNVPAKAYDATLLALYGLSEVEEVLPPLRASTDVVGHVHAEAAALTGLAVGTPVIAGMIDIDASAIGAGVVRPGPASVVVGSWSINQVVSDRLPDEADLFLQAIFADPRYWLLCEASATSASNLDWFIAQFCGDDQRTADAEGVSVYEVIGRAVDGIAPEACDLIYQPFLYGTNVHPHARAGFYHLTGWHTRAHLQRALYEGIVFGHKHHLDRLRAAGVRYDVVRLAGGAARSAVWSQLFADILETPVEVTASHETGALGAALAAGVGVSVFANLPDAAERAVHVTRTFVPNTAHRATYRARYAGYTHLLDTMRAEWDALGTPEPVEMKEERL